jgi:prevent-host-death family protein
MQEIVSIRDANQHLSRYLERVEQGAELIITRRGKPIARVLPLESRPHLTDAQRAARERLGLLQRPLLVCSKRAGTKEIVVVDGLENS